jgi:hypothetical protein
MEFPMLWTIGLENILRNMIERSWLKLKLILWDYETRYKHKNQPKTLIKYMIDVLMF